MKITPREKGETRFSLSLPRLAFLAWGNFHMRSRFARSTIPEEKWGLLVVLANTRPSKGPNDWFTRFLPVLSGFRFSTIMVVKDHQLLKRPLPKLMSNTYGGFLFSDMEQ